MVETQFASRQKCRSAGRVTARLLLSFLAASSIRPVAASWSAGWIPEPHQLPLVHSIPTTSPEPESFVASSANSLEFTLRHIFHHGTHTYPNLHRRLDIRAKDDLWVMEDGQYQRSRERYLRAKSRQTTIQRLSDRRVEVVKSLVGAAPINGLSTTLPLSSWSMDEVNGPDVKDKETVVSLATMAANAYVPEPGTGEWEDVNGGFNFSDSFGWEGDGLRGHIFADKGNSTIVIAIKGTTPAVFDGAETTSNDKENDNLFFGCCCGAGGHYLWRKVCECSTSAFTCNQTCLVKALRMKNRYYQAVLELYGNVTEIYPNSDIWLAGHSLGGAVSSLLGLTFGLPVTTFEAPGEALAAARLDLPSPPNSQSNAPQRRKNTGAYHFGHTADPIFMGSCNAATSGCTLGGYAMESECHTGHVCIYDTVKDKGWRVGIGNHKVRGIIKNVIEAYDETPTCVPDSECVDCYNWKYFESNSTDPITSSSSSTSASSTTRTTTCQTPGWWGCRDSEDPTTTSTSSETSTSVTCSSYGWFGQCLDPTSSSVTSVVDEAFIAATASTSGSVYPAVMTANPASHPTAATAITTHSS